MSVKIKLHHFTKLPIDKGISFSFYFDHMDKPKLVKNSHDVNTFTGEEITQLNVIVNGSFELGKFTIYNDNK